MKRHYKPYGCTFSNCFKRFGSKNDWKRHENSQHYQLELWKCDEPGARHKVCGMGFGRREQFRAHLSKDHGINEPATLHQKLASCLSCYHYTLDFWCGFCRKIIQVKEKDSKGGIYERRFDHVDEHLKGETLPKMDMSDWVYPGTNQTEVSFTMSTEDTGQRASLDSVSSRTTKADHEGSASKRAAGGDVAPNKSSKKARLIGNWYCVSDLSLT